MKIYSKLSIILLILFGTTIAGAQTVFRGTVVNASTKAPIMNAKVGVNDQGVGEITDEKGRFNYRRYHEILGDKSELIISAEGYETIALDAKAVRTLFNRSSTIQLEPSTQQEADKTVKSVKLFWDISEDMLGRDVEAELAYIESFVDANKSLKIAFVAFGYEIQKEEVITIRDGYLTTLRTLINSLEYGGPSNYGILDTSGADAILFSSNGDPNYGTLKVQQETPVYTLASISQTDNGAYMKQLALYTSGEYVPVGEIENTSSQPLDAAIVKSGITGEIVDLSGPIGDAVITKKGSFDEVSTNRQGKFAIQAALGDILVISKIGYFSKEVLVERKDIGTVEIISKSDELSEIVLEGNKRVDNTIQTSNGRENKDKLGYAVSELTERDFAAGATTLQQLIQGKVSGVTVEGGLFTGSEVVYKIRGGNQSVTNNIPPIWVINGAVYQDVPNFLDVQQIASISVLKSVSATSRYGTLAAGGAFIIKTKDQIYGKAQKKKENTALVKGNDYAESAVKNMEEITPAYIERMRKLPNKNDQFKLYKKISTTQSSPLEFYVDVAKHFDKVDKNLANKVREDLAYISRNNTKALRTLAYLYEVGGDAKKAAWVYERILKIAPSEAQSYRDLALIYQEKEVGKYNQALELYINMLGEQIKGVNFEGLEKPLQSELKHLVVLHKDKIDFERLPNEWLTTDFDIDIRMVIEWSDPTVPFEFQFVNPDKKFFKWAHTLDESKERLEQELAQGFQTEEFIIDDAPKGEWLINVQYLGDAGDYVLPPFLKYTVYRHYGTPKETKEVKVVKLFSQSDKVTLGKILL
ncbi:carboxypeptidase-like regulatory domain-containing protein [Dokdonia ponticola]|uniref:Carboxypeptidase-like regulatory domain-containing protein n=1 Tax=Dokdonia ponticola TaxID=2041041 RepID=A0ABV9HUS4_9FLAO